MTDIGRVLRPGGEAAFQVSNNPDVHIWNFGWTARLKERLRIGPRGQSNEAWLGSAVTLDDLEAAAKAGGTRIERTTGEGTQYMAVRLKKSFGGKPS